MTPNEIEKRNAVSKLHGSYCSWATSYKKSSPQSRAPWRTPDRGGWETAGLANLQTGSKEMGMGPEERRNVYVVGDNERNERFVIYPSFKCNPTLGLQRNSLIRSKN